MSKEERMTNLTVEQLLDELRTKISQQTYNAYADGRKEVEQERDDLQGFLDYFNAKVPDDEYGVIPHNKLDKVLRELEMFKESNIRIEELEDKLHKAHINIASLITSIDEFKKRYDGSV